MQPPTASITILKPLTFQYMWPCPRTSSVSCCWGWSTSTNDFPCFADQLAKSDSRVRDWLIGFLMLALRSSDRMYSPKETMSAVVYWLIVIWSLLMKCFLILPIHHSCQKYQSTIRSTVWPERLPIRHRRYIFVSNSFMTYANISQMTIKCQVKWLVFSPIFYYTL